MNLTEHFSYEEMTDTNHVEFLNENRKQGGPFVPNMVQVCGRLEKVRKFFNCPVIVDSGFRYPALNAHVKGSSNSQHMTGDAADFKLRDFNDFNGLKFVFLWCMNNVDYGQLILENPPGSKPWIHIGLPRIGRAKTQYVFEQGVYRPV